MNSADAADVLAALQQRGFRLDLERGGNCSAYVKQVLEAPRPFGRSTEIAIVAANDPTAPTSFDEPVSLHVDDAYPPIGFDSLAALLAAFDAELQIGDDAPFTFLSFVEVNAEAWDASFDLLAFLTVGESATLDLGAGGVTTCRRVR